MQKIEPFALGGYQEAASEAVPTLATEAAFNAAEDEIADILDEIERAGGDAPQPRLDRLSELREAVFASPPPTLRAALIVLQALAEHVEAGIAFGAKQYRALEHVREFIEEIEPSVCRDAIQRAAMRRVCRAVPLDADDDAREAAIAAAVCKAPPTPEEAFAELAG